MEQQPKKSARGFANIELINLSLLELFLRLRRARIRQFAENFDVSSHERVCFEDPVIRVQKIARKFAEHYRIAVSSIIVTFRSDIRVPGRVELSRTSDFFIDIHSCLRDHIKPILAILAHEVAHIFLYQAGISLKPAFHNEVLTDTAAVFLGCGVAILNGASETQVVSGNVISTTTMTFGYLSVDEFGYIQAKRDAFFRSTPSKLINPGLPLWGYYTGRRRHKKELKAAPYAAPGFFTRLFKKQPQPDPSQKIVFPCSYCSQLLRVPRLGKLMAVHCPTCDEKSPCHT